MAEEEEEKTREKINAENAENKTKKGKIREMLDPRAGQKESAKQRDAHMHGKDGNDGDKGNGYEQSQEVVMSGNKGHERKKKKKRRRDERDRITANEKKNAIPEQKE